ncbi:hypothetical protein Bbelb_268310 [Branchiostoma belcheri]|nr:hypothetical protein Bbelb_268310 [Branchiostoma belcheri]
MIANDTCGKKTFYVGPSRTSRHPQIREFSVPYTRDPQIVAKTCSTTHARINKGVDGRFGHGWLVRGWPVSSVPGAKGSAAGSRAASAVDEGPVSEARKEFYLIQIKDLERKRERQQQKAQELEDANKEFKDQYDQMSKDKHDIVTFLKRTLQERIDEVADLTDRLSALQQDKDQEKEAYEETIKSMKAEFQETKDNLSTENMNLQRALAGLEEFKIQREDLMRKFANLEEDSRKLQDEHQEQMYKLERKAVVDKDRLKKEMVLKVNQVAAEFRKVSNKQMADTTKRTIRENASINSQLTKMSDKTMDMLQEIDELRAKEKHNRQQKQLLEANEKELAKKIHSSQKVIRMLTEKSKQTEALLAEFEAREMEYQEMQSESHLIRTQNEAMKQELQKISRELDNKEEQVIDLQQSLDDETKAKLKLEQLILDTAASMHNALKSDIPGAATLVILSASTHRAGMGTTVKTEKGEQVTTGNRTRVVRLAGPAPDDPDFEALLEQREKRDGMLEQILAMLNSAAALGFGPAPGRLGKTSADTFRTKTSFLPAVGIGLKKGTVSMSPFATPEGTVAHYQLGDLGLVPKPREAMMASMAQSVGGLSHTTSRLGAVRDPRRVRSVGVQTASAQRAMFFADQLLRSPVKGLDYPEKIAETSFTQQERNPEWSQAQSVSLAVSFAASLSATSGTSHLGRAGVRGSARRAPRCSPDLSKSSPFTPIPRVVENRLGTGQGRCAGVPDTVLFNAYFSESCYVQPTARDKDTTIPAPETQSTNCFLSLRHKFPPRVWFYVSRPPWTEKTACRHFGLSVDINFNSKVCDSFFKF